MISGVEKKKRKGGKRSWEVQHFEVQLWYCTAEKQAWEKLPLKEVDVFRGDIPNALRPAKSAGSSSNRTKVADEMIEGGGATTDGAKNERGGKIGKNASHLVK